MRLKSKKSKIVATHRIFCALTGKIFFPNWGRPACCYNNIILLLGFLEGDIDVWTDVLFANEFVETIFDKNTTHIIIHA